MGILDDPLAAHVHAPDEGAAGAAALRFLGRLPHPLRLQWSTHPHGHILIHPQQVPSYWPDQYHWRHLDTRAVLLFAPTTINEGAPHFWAIVGYWLDHWLGANAQPTRPWLSEGGKHLQTPLLQQAALELTTILARGYAPPPPDSVLQLLPTHQGGTCHEKSHFYQRACFAHGFSLALCQPRTLSAADPHLARWFRATLLSTPWWHRALQG